MVRTKKIDATTDVKRALSSINEDTVLATDFLTQVPSEYQDAYGSHRLGTSGGEAWSYEGDSSNSRVLIVRNLATSQNSGGSARRPIYIDSASYNCTTTLASQPKLTYISIYFVYQDKLYKRILTDKTQTLCPSQAPYQLHTCPPDISPGSWDSSCEANDEILATNVSKFQVSYYQSGSVPGGTLVAGQYSSSDPNILQAANIVDVTIEEDFAGLTDPISITQSFARIN